MLTEALAALAAAGGTAVVSAACTDLWTTVRTRTARLLGQGRPGTEQTALQRLDATAAELAPVEGEIVEAEAGRLAARWATVWETRFADLLDAATETEREQLAAQLQTLVEEVRVHPQVAQRMTALGDHSSVIGRDVKISAKEGGYAGWEQNFGSGPGGNPGNPPGSGPPPQG